MKEYLREHLILWKDSGIPAPANELQSIAGWLQFLGEHGEAKTKDAMNKRIILLEQAAIELYEEGPEAEAAAGIYKNRPELNNR